MTLYDNTKTTLDVGNNGNLRVYMYVQYRITGTEQGQ